MKINVFPLFIPNFYLCVLTEYILEITSKFKYNYCADLLQQLNCIMISNLTHCTRLKVRENIGPLSPYISQTTENFEILPDAKSKEKL